MSNWITITTDDVRDYLADEQLQALRTQALGTDQADPLPAIISDVAALVRARVAANASNTLDATAERIPPELRGAACALVVEAAQGRLPGLGLTADQVRMANAARTLLRHVAEGKVAIEAPEGSGDEGDSVQVSRQGFVLLGRRDGMTSSASLSAL
jgi:hypothetical protein